MSFWTIFCFAVNLQMRLPVKGINWWQVLWSEAVHIDIAYFCPSISAKTTVLSRILGQIIIFTDKIIHLFYISCLLSMKSWAITPTEIQHLLIDSTKCTSQLNSHWQAWQQHVQIASTNFSDGNLWIWWVFLLYRYILLINISRITNIWYFCCKILIIYSLWN